MVFLWQKAVAVNVAVAVAVAFALYLGSDEMEGWQANSGDGTGAAP